MTDSDFLAGVLHNPINRTILERLPALDLPDAWLVSGALFQTVWNGLTDRPPEYGIRDYDIFYFDPDTSWDAEDAVIRRAKDTFADVEATSKSATRHASISGIRRNSAPPTRRPFAPPTASTGF